MTYTSMGAVVQSAKTGADLSIATQQERLGYVVGGSDSPGAVPTFRAKVTQVHGRPLRQVVPEDRKAVLDAVSQNYVLVERGTRQDPTQTEVAGLAYGVGKLAPESMSGKVGTWITDQIAVGNAILLFDRLVASDGTPAIEVVATRSLPSASDLTISGQSGPHWHLLVPPQQGWTNVDPTQAGSGIRVTVPPGQSTVAPGEPGMVELWPGFRINPYVAVGAVALGAVGVGAGLIMRARKRRGR